MATRDLIPDPEFFVVPDVDDLEEVFVAPAFDPEHAPEHGPAHGAEITRELHVVPDPPAPPPTVGSTFRLLTALMRERLRNLRPELDRQGALRLIGQGVSIVGVLLVALAFFEGFAGRITEQRDQRKLRGAFEDILEQQGGFAPIAGDGIIPPGTPVAAIEIPKLGVRKLVIEGTTSDHLRQGPGHLRSTPLPGQHGNAVIAGRRTTYGGPFRNLDRLGPGDEIVTHTPFGTFNYLVRDVETLAPGDPDRLGATMTDNLTLTTSDPVYRATRRLVVVARLDGRSSPYPDPLRQTQVDLEEAAFFGDAGKALPTFGWTVLVLLSLVAARALYGRWRRWPAYLITTPIVLAATFGWLESMVGLLPSTL